MYQLELSDFFAPGDVSLNQSQLVRGYIAVHNEHLLREFLVQFPDGLQQSLPLSPVFLLDVRQLINRGEHKDDITIIKAAINAIENSTTETILES